MISEYNKLRALDEAPIGNILRKQASIYRLWPQFDDRVRGVAKAGGIRLVDETPTTWTFQINSATVPGKKYSAVLHFNDLPQQLRRFVPDKRLWNKEGTHVDYRKLASAIYDVVDMKVDHTDCPAYQFWGLKYISTQRSTQYRDPENRRPAVRNPKEYGHLCKHLQLLFDQLPFYISTFAKMLKRQYAEFIAKEEQKALKTRGEFKGAGEYLGKKAKESVNKQIDAMNDEMVDFYFKRTHHHIALVNAAIHKIVEEYPEFQGLIERGVVHDASKFESPEKEPYIYLTWKKKCEADGTSYDCPEDIKDQIHNATVYHVTSNSHHPEFHSPKLEDTIDPNDRDKSTKVINASKMPDLDIAEMVADWQAMSAELKTNTARQWYDSQRNKRWKFTPHQEQLIDKLLKVFETKMEKESVNEVRIYTLTQMEKIQKEGSSTHEKGGKPVGFIFGSTPEDKFILTKVNISDIKQGGSKWKFALTDYQKKDMKDSVSIIQNLMRVYSVGDKVTPIVVDEDNNMMDGRHRLVAQKELGYKEIPVFKRIANSSEHINESSEQPGPFTDETGVYSYDIAFKNQLYAKDVKKIIGTVAQLKPMEYFEIIVTGLGHRNMADMLQFASSGNTEEMKKAISSGAQLYRPVLEYRYIDVNEPQIVFNQDGRHRMKAVMDLGYQKVGVAVILPSEDKYRELAYELMPLWFSDMLRKQIKGIK